MKRHLGILLLALVLGLGLQACQHAVAPPRGEKMATPSPFGALAEVKRQIRGGEDLTSSEEDEFGDDDYVDETASTTPPTEDKE